MRRMLLLLPAAAPAAFGLLLTASGPSAAHDWYPHECCHHNDCAPVDHAVQPPNSGDMVVTSKHGTATVPNGMRRRDSQDGRMHVCMQPTASGRMRVICVFVPPLI